MTDSTKDMTLEQRRELLKKALAARSPKAKIAVQAVDVVPEEYYKFDKFPQYHRLHMQRVLGEQAGLENPFFRCHEGIAKNRSIIDGREVINFATYNYLGLNGHPRILEAFEKAAHQYGTTASASRVVSGERPPHRALECLIAKLHGTEDALAFVSGHATNVSAIAALMGPKDLILHDRLVHNSAVQGAILSGASRQAFNHNDMDHLEELLAENRHRFDRVLILVEGLFSMDGDLCPLPQLVEIKSRHKALLMVDEAHSMGTVGRRGLGVAEHFGIDPKNVDIWMGTLSKSFVGCGGYIAGCTALIELLKFTAAGFVYSVGLSPPLAAASMTAMEIMLEEPSRVEMLQHNSRTFLDACRNHGLDTGYCAGFNVVPVIVAQSLMTAKLANMLFAEGIDAPPIVYPAVEERAARLRFFISSLHQTDEITQTVQIIAKSLAKLQYDKET